MVSVMCSLMLTGALGDNPDLFLKKLKEELAKRGNPWIAGTTEVSHLPWEEKKKLMCPGLIEVKEEHVGRDPTYLPDIAPRVLPDELDWRNYKGHNWMTSLKDQGNTAACWAFAWAGAQEARWKIVNEVPNINLDLSEQFLVSCNPYGYDCNPDGTMGNINLGNWIKRDGIVDEECFPWQYSSYPDCQRSCRERCSDWRDRVYKISDWDWTTQITTTQAKQWLLSGPIPVAIRQKEDFFYFKGGCYTPIMGRTRPNHAVILIGWTADGKWLVKNSTGYKGCYHEFSGPLYYGSWMTPLKAGNPLIEVPQEVRIRVRREKELLLPSSEDTIKYDDWKSGQQGKAFDGVSYWATKFTPPIKCKVIAGINCRFTQTAQVDTFFLMEEAGDGGPGEVILSFPYATQSGAGGRWYRQDLPTPYETDKTFVIGYYAKTGRTSKFMADMSGGERSYNSRNRVEWEDMIRANGDLLIRAIVIYERTGEGKMLVKNVGTGYLSVREIRVKNNASWITGIIPKDFVLAEGKSQEVKIIVNTTGLDVNQTYTDTLELLSNSSEEITEVPVILEFVGIEELVKEGKTYLKVSTVGKEIHVFFFLYTPLKVELKLYNVVGRVVKNVQIEGKVGKNSIKWDTNEIASGIYFCKLKTGKTELVKKITLIK